MLDRLLGRLDDDGSFSRRPVTSATGRNPEDAYSIFTWASGSGASVS
jgi:hypothetical protein